MALHSSDIDAVWKTHVWQHPSVLAVTPRIHDYDVLGDSQAAVALLYHNTRVNFFTATVRRKSEPLAYAQTRYTVRAVVTYYLQQADVPGTTYKLCRDRLEMVDDLVIAALGSDWKGVVGYYDGASPQDVTGATVDGKQCWRGGLVYEAVRTE